MQWKRKVNVPDLYSVNVKLFMRRSSLPQKPAYAEGSYIEANERSPIGGGDDGARGFDLPVYCSILLSTALVCVRKPKTLVASGICNCHHYCGQNSRRLEGIQGSALEGKA